MGQRLTSHCCQLLLNTGYMLLKHCGVLLAITLRNVMKSLASGALEGFSAGIPKAQQGKPILYQLARSLSSADL